MKISIGWTVFVVSMMALCWGAFFWVRSSNGDVGIVEGRGAVNAPNKVLEGAYKSEIPASSRAQNTNGVGASDAAFPAGTGTTLTLPVLGGVRYGSPAVEGRANQSRLTGGAAELSGTTLSITQNSSPATPIEQIQQRLQLLTSSGRPPRAAEVDAVLADLQKIQGNNVAGVNLTALRDTLARVDRIQQISSEMQAAVSTPGRIDRAKVQGLMLEMQNLQAGMKSGAAQLSASK